MRERFSRRRVILGTGVLATTATSSIAFTTNRASATASVSGDFQIPDGTTALADTTLTDVRLEVDASYQFDANAHVHAIELELHVGASADTLDLIARHEQAASPSKNSPAEELNGSLMSASDFDISDFQPSNGELSRTVLAELRFYALRDGEVAAEARESATFDVVVRDEELQVNAVVGGEGSVVFKTSEG